MNTDFAEVMASLLRVPGWGRVPVPAYTGKEQFDLLLPGHEVHGNLPRLTDSWNTTAQKQGDYSSHAAQSKFFQGPH